MSATSERGGLAELIRSRRIAAGLTQEELAERSGLSVRAISDIERGRTTRPYRRSVDLLTGALASAEPARGELAGRPWTAPGETGRPAQVPADESTGAGNSEEQVVPRQLPVATRHFAGRAGELMMLDGLLAGALGAPGLVVISAIAGTAGVGKTALAVHWSHQVAGQFPDGQLYVNLRGYDPSGVPVTPAAALRGFLHALHVPPAQIPVGPDAQAGLYRSLLAGKRMLIVLDNARDAAQVRPLLPGDAACFVIVTSRSKLVSLAAAEGAHLLSLDVLTDADARELLSRQLGPECAQGMSEAVSELIGLCARLPLALTIAAARAATGPSWTLITLAEQLRHAQSRLDALDAGDAVTSVRAVFSWSCQRLSNPAARMFLLLGVHPGPDITVAAAASLAGVSLAQARREIAELADAHLISEHLPGRFTFHDLLRAYAAEQARSQGSEADCRAALHRVLDHYLHTASAASLVMSYRDPITLSPLQPGAAPEELTDREQALAWFQAERQVLLGAARQASDSGFSMHAWQIPWAMATFLDWFGNWHEMAATQQSAVVCAQRIGDRYGQAEARRQLARGLIRLGAVADAIMNLTAAIELGTQVGDGVLQARTHHDLGGVFESQGRMNDALGHAEQAMRLYREAGHRWGQAVALSGMGWSHAQLGRYHEALDFCGHAMTIFRELDIRLGQSATLDSLGYIHHQLGEYAEAISCFQEAISIDGDAGDQRTRAEVLIHLGDSQLATGNQQEARAAWQEALLILDALRRPDASRVRAKLRSCGEARPVPGQAGRRRGAPGRRHPRQAAVTVNSPSPQRLGAGPAADTGPAPA